ncbi:hypothetical protein [Ideonella sp. A 288]|uniref:hypothetical protein n=1 Tax=Ideonella sp. A 288 TaxID=1962181 RepID=UPI000B4AEBD8|nr:hypothetical protein [Ideonella sp. A 288]
MKLLFWISGLLLIPLAGSSIFFFVLYLSTGEPVPKERAKALYRWSVVVVLGTFDIWIFARVIDGIKALIH